MSTLHHSKVVATNTTLIADTLESHTRQLPHSEESDLHRSLMADEKLNFESLVVRKTAEGFCVDGVLNCHTPDDAIRLAARIAEAGSVRNNVVVHRKPR